MTLLLVACTSQTSGTSNRPVESTSEEAATSTSVTTDAPKPSFVGISTRLVADDARFLLVAQQTLIARCMEERGFLYIIPEIPEDPFDQPDRRWTVVVPETAAETGYGLYARLVPPAEGDDPSQGFQNGVSDFEGDMPPGTDTGDPHGDYLNTLSEDEMQAWMAALTGTADHATVVPGEGEGGGDAFIFTDGCVAQVEGALYGDVVALLKTDQLIAQIRGEQSERVASDPRFGEAKREWFRCMSAEGFDVETFGGGYDLAQSGYEELPLEEARVFEIEIATIDAACAKDSGVNRVFRELLAEADEHMEEEYVGELLGLQELQEQAVLRAKELLADG
ncbi:MAG: hypothetical protein DWP92_07560 [Armatimonadetes bacterium]|nr:MAG: hypothetical protein DWP92_07560 [Armatimonadota bacterium]